MSEETKKDLQKDPTEAIELSNQDLEQVAGGTGWDLTANKTAASATDNRNKSADKTFPGSSF
jgi:hypothetical protein